MSGIRDVYTDGKCCVGTPVLPEQRVRRVAAPLHEPKRALSGGFWAGTHEFSGRGAADCHISLARTVRKGAHESLGGEVAETSPADKMRHLNGFVGFPGGPVSNESACWKLFVEG